LHEQEPRTEEDAMRKTQAGLAAVVVLASAACGGHGPMMTGPSAMMGASAVAPTVLVAVSPRGNAADVPIDAPIAVRFSRPMVSGTEMLVYLHENDVTGPVVPLNRTWSGDGTTLVCTPTAPLRSHFRYTIHIGGGMVDADGRVLGWDSMPGLGGQWVLPSMMSGSLLSYMMAPGWRGTNGAYGAAFSFATA
jgi:hypothetical protein